MSDASVGVDVAGMRVSHDASKLRRRATVAGSASDRSLVLALKAAVTRAESTVTHQQVFCALVRDWVEMEYEQVDLLDQQVQLAMRNCSHRSRSMRDSLTQLASRLARVRELMEENRVVFETASDFDSDSGSEPEEDEDEEDGEEKYEEEHSKPHHRAERSGSDDTASEDS